MAFPPHSVRHWILGLGSGDVHIATTGAKKADFGVSNVMFIDAKLAKIQRLAAMRSGINQEFATERSSGANLFLFRLHAGLAD